jgi:N6-L-threonylcarbamoyladenine synthase
MKILSIETSCDETSCAIIEDGNKIISSVVLTQIDIHKKFGGVIPELASRHHVTSITLVINEALEQANMEFKDIDFVAVTKGPGLIGSLLIGINAAKTVAYANDLPILGVNHMVGHMYANVFESELKFPCLALIVSGGHTELVLMKDHFEFVKLGETLDDAVGECYDKVGRVLDLPYPGGPLVDKLAHLGKPEYKLPKVYLGKDSYDFSFSGLKSAVINLVHNLHQKNQEVNKENLCASFQDVVTEVLVEKTKRAAHEFNAKQIIVAGGVAANKGLRERLTQTITDIEVVLPQLKYCTDNAAMIGAAAYYQYQKYQQFDDISLNGDPLIDIDDYIEE